MNMMMASCGPKPDISVSLADAYPNATGYGEPIQAYYRLGSDKKIYFGVQKRDGVFATPGPITWSEVGAWCAPGGTASDYEVRATVTAGSLYSGTTGSWLGLGSTWDWSVFNGSFNGVLSCTMTIEIRNASTQRRVALTTVTISAAMYW